MSITDNKNYPFSFSMIDIKKIDPSPYQYRKFFDEDSLRELGVSIVKDGLIEPIIVRPQKKDRFQLIAGERRLRAIKDYTDMKMIQAKRADVDDLQARRISFTENLLRQDLSAIESIEETIEIIDEEMGKDPEYLTVGKTPLERVVKLLSKLDSIRFSKDRGSMVSKEVNDLFHKFMEQVESIFKNLPKPLKWRSFLNNDLILLTDIPLKVQKASVKLDLNKAQTKSLAKLEQVSGKVFHEVIQKGSIPLKDQNNHLQAKIELKEFRAREIQAFAEDIEKTNIKNQQRIDTAQREFSTQIKIAVMTRLGIPHVRIAQQLNIHRETISKYAQKNQELFKKMAARYMKGSISDFTKPQYLNFFRNIFSLMREQSKPSTLMAFLNADFRDFQGIPAVNENPDKAILMFTYAKLLETCGWKVTHLTDCPLSTERFTGNMVNKMHEKRTLGIVRRTLIIGKPDILHLDMTAGTYLYPEQVK